VRIAAQTEGTPTSCRPLRLHRPLLAIGLVAVGATAAALFLPPMAAILTGVGLVLLCALPPLWRAERLLLLLTAALFLLSTALYQQRQVLPLERLNGMTDTVTGVVVEQPRKGQMYTIEVTAAQRLPAGTRLSLYCTPGSEPLLQDEITVSVTLNTITYSRTYLWSKEVFLCGFPTDRWGEAITLLGGGEPPAGQGIALLQNRFYAILRQVLPGEEGALLAALCLGVRTDLSAETTAAFQNSGLSHLLVVSGLHLSMVAVSLRRLLRRLQVGYRLSAVLTLPVLVVFALLVGASSSVLRAGIMCAIWLLSFVAYRRYDGLNALGLALAILLLDQPYRLLNVGFQLSFLAAAGVLLLAPRLCKPSEQPSPTDTTSTRIRRAVWGFIRNGCGVCISALLFTLPLTAHYFGGVSLTALCANLLAVIPAGWALMIGWLGMLCGALPLLGWLSRPLLCVAGWLARYLHTVALGCGPDSAFLPTPRMWQQILIAALCIVIVCGILCRIPRRRVMAVVSALTVLTFTLAVPLTAHVTRLTVLSDGAHVSVLVQQGRRAVLLASHSKGLADTLRELERQGCSHLEQIYIQEGSTANGGTLTALWLKTDTPPIYTADRDNWYGGLEPSVTPCAAGDAWQLWGQHRLTLLEGGWWRLDTRGGDLLIGTDPHIPCPASAALTVYAGVPDTLPEERHCIVACRTKDPPTIPLTPQTLVLVDDSITLTTRYGKEWSVLPWL